MQNHRQANHTSTPPAKILFLVPPNITFDDFINPPRNISTIQKSGRLFGSLITDIPLGIISLSAYIKKHVEAEVNAIDFNVELNKEEEFSYNTFYEYFYDKLKQEKYRDLNPQYVGISALFTPAYTSILNLADIARAAFPEAMVLVGGNFPTAMYRSILKDSQSVDAVCYGEGEKALLNLINASDKHDFIMNSVSWVNHKKLDDPKMKLSHDFIYDLDEIPMLDYDILDIEGYKLNPTSSRYSVKEKYSVKQNNKSLDQEETAGMIEAIGEISYSMPIMTSRGCPFKCTFCASHAAHGREMRYHSLERVVEDAKAMIQRFGIDGVVIQDDHFMAGKSRPYQVVDALGKLGLGMFFQNALAIYALDLEFLKLLKRSGVDALVLPIESGSARVLKELMKKPLKLDIVPKVLNNCREAGIFTDCNIILGMPGETMDDINDSRNFLKTIYADWFRIFVATPIPGSEMYEECEANDLFKITPLNANYKRAVVGTKFLSPEQVQQMTYLMNIELNFVYNANVRLGNFDIALESFINVINVKPDHAIAHYYAGVCQKNLGNEAGAQLHFEKAYIHSQETDFWDQYITMFNIPIVEHYRAYQAA